MRTRLISAALAASALLLLTGCASAQTAPATEASVSTPSPTTAGCAYTASGQAAAPATAPPSDARPAASVSAVLQTSAGDIPMTLTGERTPCTVESFVSLAQQNYFTDTTCHRLTTSGIYVLQCGDPTGTGMGGPGYRFGDELDGTETYPAGTVAMANAGPNTNGSQFFLVYKDSPLPAKYTVFGTLSPEGLAVVSKIAQAGVSGGGADGAPATAVKISGVTIG
ncbi:peptidyl-prolyl cis-trans isomerase B (cyclophilin B) [Microbacterium testaceum]|uniref:peptidylprolyl isomerase n=1 Tax=Microbacterium TaxID=33882 RepID=UPI002787C7B6|nr:MULTISPECIES: peptidylprolyl isomerase [Microbacterium]MDQ1111772.1 peptidyl-prolyl cis-trans isomerase B (cyclophilin B) [Microbacterium testaceum]MDR6097691.1 peptidyl-prolyl cis-trans isomerase B (cyclophilin B) [Microbacterium sp. SORGH_AS_0454]